VRRWDGGREGRTDGRRDGGREGEREEVREGGGRVESERKRESIEAGGGVTSALLPRPNCPGFY